MKDFRSTFNNRSVLITGHTGFKGSWLTAWLTLLGARVSGYALDPPTRPSHFEVADISELLENDFRGDIRDTPSLRDAINLAEPEFIFHMAAQPLVIESLRDPKETFDVNVIGTCSVLDIVKERNKDCVVVVITSDKCYRNNEEGTPFQETDSLGGNDPYSASKAATELVVESYRHSFFREDGELSVKIRIASARAGNVIGGGDWAPDRIVPDAIQSLFKQTVIDVRNPNSTRPWQHVLEPLSGYLLLASHMDDPLSPTELQSSWNFGPDSDDSFSVQTLVDSVIRHWGSGKWEKDRSVSVKEAKSLRIDIGKARQQIGWSPQWNLETTIEKTVHWYHEFLEMKVGSALQLTSSDIIEYQKSLSFDK